MILYPKYFTSDDAKLKKLLPYSPIKPEFWESFKLEPYKPEPVLKTIQDYIYYIHF